MTTSSLFARASEIGRGKPEKRFGHPYNGRYHMPLLPGEAGVKSGGDWVPYGIQRMTNLVGALEDTRALNIWEQALGLVGIALSPELYEELTLIVHQAQSEGVIFELMRDYTVLKETLAGAPHDQAKIEQSIIGRAKAIARAGAAAQRGTNRHTAWEHRGKTGELIGTASIQTAVQEGERLLAEAGLVRLPGLSERIVRNTVIGAVGKFDDIVMSTKTGKLYIADLKTKATAFYSWMSTDAQLAGYAKSEHMLTIDEQGYEPGPLHAVDQESGVVLHVPSDGSPARLERADLVTGWETAQMCRRIIELRSYGKSVDRHSRAIWSEES